MSLPLQTLLYKKIEKETFSHLCLLFLLGAAHLGGEH